MNFYICLEVDHLNKINVLVVGVIRLLDIVLLENAYLFY